MGQAFLRAAAFTCRSRPLVASCPQHLVSNNSLRTCSRLSFSLVQAQFSSKRPRVVSSPSFRPTMTVLSQIRGHAGHSHSHASDNAYLVSANKNDEGVRITRIGLFVNLGMAVAKGIGGFVFNSQALIADAFHALTDLVSDFMTLATISLSIKPPNDRFPTGYGKLESMGAFGVSAMLLLGGTAMGAQGLDALYVQAFTDAVTGEHPHGLFGGFLHSHSHSHGPSIPSLHAAWLAAGSIVVKEQLYRSTMKIAKKRKSSVLASNAVHHRIDSLTSIVALLTIGGSHVFTNASWLDPVGGIIISAMVIKAGFGNIATSLYELADVTVDDDIKKSVTRSATKALKGDPTTDLKGVHMGDQVEIVEVEGIKSGQNYLIDIDLAVPSSFTVKDTMVIEQAVRERLGAKVRGVRRVRVKFTTKEASADSRSDFITANVSPRGSPELENENDHDHDHHHGNGHAHGSKKDQ